MNEINWRSHWANDQIRSMLIEQSDSFWNRDTGTERSKLKEVEAAALLPHAVIVSGLRRVGKSTLLAQIAHKLSRDSFYYINFEDDRFLGFQAEDANDLYQMLVEIFGDRKTFFIDEIQNIPGWEYFVRRFMDMGLKFYITGSNASLLSQELGTRLTGRYIPIELFPFSFTEYLKFRNEELPDFQRLTTVKKARLNELLNDYLSSGGIPESLKYPEFPLLQTLYDDVIYRDIATRHKLDAVTALKKMAFYLISNPAGLVNFNKLKAQLQLGSVNTVINYVEYMQNSWLIFTLNLYAYSLKRQQIAPKKVYCIDTGMVNTVGFYFSLNSGKLMENLVFLALRRCCKEIYYYKTAGDYEVDFYLPEKKQLIQVAYHLNDPATRDREIRSIAEAMKEIKVESALILSDANEDDVLIDGLPIKIRSTSEWLIDWELES